MKKRALIYTRVSTVDQADNGYSLGHQQALLRQYCKINNIKIVMHFEDNCSAKNFNRPSFIQLKEYAKKNKKDIDLLLVVKWDRFSRNSEEALREIREFSNIGIAINSIEQPLDLTIPDNKILLTMYLVIPEVENDKNSQRTTDGMRRANKEGFWTTGAPVGYKNTRNSDGKSTLAVGEKGELVKQVFLEYAKGIYNAEELRRIMRSKGLKTSKQGFYNILSNITYTGKIRVKEWKNEPEQIVLGEHPPLISQELFDRVQKIRNQGRRIQAKPKKKNALFPLRGHLICPDCESNLTASISKGRNKRYSYYHCSSKCGFRESSEVANIKFVGFLSSIKIKEEIKDLYQVIMQDIFRKRTKSNKEEIKRIDAEIERNQERLNSNNDKFLDGMIEQRIYNSNLERFTNLMDELNAERITMLNMEDDYMLYFKYGTHLLTNLDTIYEKIEDVGIKQKLIGSIFPEKLVFDGNNYRTAKYNSLLALLANDSGKTNRLKIEKSIISDGLSSKAPPPGLEPGTY